MALNTDANLVGRYDFEDASNPGLDTSTAGTNSMTNFGTSTYLEGTRYRVLNLPSATTYLQLSSIFSSPTSITVSAWVKVFSTGSNQTIIDIGNTIVLSYLDAGNFAASYVTSGASTTLTSPLTYSTNTWYFLTFTCTTGAQALYVNATSVATGTSSFVVGAWTWASATATSRIARSTAGNLYAGGNLDDVRVYSRALSGAEVTALYAYAATPSTLCFAPCTRIELMSGKQVRVDQLKPNMLLKSNTSMPLKVVSLVTQPSDVMVRFDPGVLNPAQDRHLLVTPHHVVKTKNGYCEAADAEGGVVVKLNNPMTVYHICANEWGMVCAENVHCETAAWTDEQETDRRKFLFKAISGLLPVHNHKKAFAPKRIVPVD